MRLIVLGVVVMCATLLSGGCGTGPFPASGPVSSRSAQPAAAAPPAHAVPARLSIPLTLARAAAGFGCVVVDVSAGGGPSVPVAVDTGSSGLLLPATVIGPKAQPTGRGVQDGFVGTPRFTADVVRAPVSIGGPGGVTTPNPIAIGSVTVAGALSGLARCGGAQGLLGVGVGNSGPAVPVLESPLLQLASPLNDGFTITTVPTVTLLVGKPILSPTTVSLPLPVENGADPDGRQAYQRDVTLCWTVGSARGCGPTNIDSGFSFPAIRPDFLPTAPHQGVLIPGGTPISITAPDGTTLESFTTAPTPPEVRMRLANLFGTTEANTGIGFFLSHSVGFDVSTGHAVITPDNSRSTEQGHR